jgi:hypothetical protein
MERDQLGTLSPADAAVALRSFPRRYREAIEEARAKHADLDVTVAQGGHRAPLVVVVAASTVLGRLRQGVEHTLTDTGHSLEPSLLDRTALEATSGMTGQLPRTMDAALEALQEVTTGFADLAQHTPLREWDRGALIGQTPVTALDLLKDAVAAGRTYLDELSAGLDAVATT